ncbi:IS630 family transposase [Patescibacteria group bacterium]|nr:MAG: IS630 family transposase [Patescibacteria group bacterium]
MWCVPTLTPQFIERMEALLTLYAKPYSPDQPVICFDEKSKALRADVRPLIPATVSMPRKRDYEYKRNGTANIFLAVEPKGGWREATVTKRRTKRDFAEEIKRLLKTPRYCRARKIHLVLDNLNTHGTQSLRETFSLAEAERLLGRVRFHYTPKHASWLNMAEIELSILSRQALGARIPTRAALTEGIQKWQQKRNAQRALIRWQFTKADARKVFKYQEDGRLS